MASEVVWGYCIDWGNDDYPRLETCELEKMDAGHFHRHYPNSKDYEEYEAGVDFFTDRLAGLKAVRRLLVKHGEECQQALERVGLDVWTIDTQITQESRFGHENI